MGWEEASQKHLARLDSKRVQSDISLHDLSSIMEPSFASSSFNSSCFSSNHSDLGSFSSSESSLHSLSSTPSFKLLRSTWNDHDILKSSTPTKITGCITSSSSLVSVGDNKDSSRVLIVGSSHGIQPWNPQSGLGFLKQGTHHGAVKAITSFQDGQNVNLVSAHGDHSIRLWKMSKASSSHESGLKLVCSMPTWKDCIKNIVKPKGYVHVRRNKKSLWLRHIDVISCLSVSSDGKSLYSGSWDRSVKVWRLKDGVCVESFRAHEDAINAIALSQGNPSNGTILYTACANGQIKAWRKMICKNKRNSYEHVLVSTLDKHKSAVNALALTTDGKVLYSGGCDGTIIVWHNKSSSSIDMHPLSLLKGHKQAILCLHIIDQRFLCSGSADKTVRVWDMDGGKCLAVLEGHTSPVKSITSCFDGVNGFVIYSASLDGEIRTWLTPSLASKDSLL